MQTRANFHLERCTANDTISKFEIASVKKTDLMRTQSLVILHSKMAKCKWRGVKNLLLWGTFFWENSKTGLQSLIIIC